MVFYSSLLGAAHLFIVVEHQILFHVLTGAIFIRSEEHTSELQSLRHLVCRLLLEKKKIVLVVDDEPTIVESLSKIFRREGLTVLSPTDATAGLDVRRKQRVGGLLTDRMMTDHSAV